MLRSKSNTLPSFNGAFVLAAALGLLTACSGGAQPSALDAGLRTQSGSQTLPATVPDLADQRTFANDTGPRYVYISDANFVDEFDRYGKLKAKITSGMNAPQGIFVDTSHNVWIANAYGGNVLMFAEGATSPTRTLDDTGALPSDVTLGPDGTAYVANILDPNGPGSILVYPPGQNTASRKLRDPIMEQNRFITIDAKGDLFVTTAIKGLPQFVGRVEEYVGAEQSGLRHFKIKLGSPGGIKWVSGMLYVCDTTEHSVTQYTDAGVATGRKLVTGGAWDGIDVSPDGKTVLGADQTYLQGITRGFPRGRIGMTFADPSFQAPTGAAFQTDQKGF